jgi:hypothetical protein
MLAQLCKQTGKLYSARRIERDSKKSRRRCEYAVSGSGLCLPNQKIFINSIRLLLSASDSRVPK